MQLWWLLGVAVVVIFAQGLVYKLWSLRRLEYQAWFASDEAFVGDETELVEQISNRKRLPLPWVRLESSFDLSLKFAGHKDVRVARGQQFHQFHRSVFSLPMLTRITRRHRIRCTERGVFHLTGAVMTVGDLLGTHQRTKRIGLNSELVVYPAVLRLDELPIPAHRWLGEAMVRRWIVPDPFYISGTRAYSAGDSLRDINWKATARTGDLMVHQHDFTADHRLLLLLNVQDSPEMWETQAHPERIEEAISLAASIAYLAIGQGAEVGFASNGSAGGVVQTEVRSGREHLSTILDTMARMTLTRAMAFDRLIWSYVEAGLTDADVLVMTEYIDGEMTTAVEALRAAGNAVVMYPLGEGARDVG